MVRRVSIAMAGLAALGGALSVLGPASVADAAQVSHHGLHASRPGGLRARGSGARMGKEGVTVSSSTNWSGYSALGTYTSVSSNWTVPTGVCSSGDQYDSSWVGLDGFTAASSTVEQTGTETDCDGKTPAYYAWYEMYPGPSENFSNKVKAGDKMYASVVYDPAASVRHRSHRGGGGSTSSSKTYTLVLQDITENWTKTETASVKGALNSSAEVIDEAPCCTNSGGILPLTDTTPETFTNATANGLPIGDATDLQETYMADTKGVTQSSVSALTGGNSFTVTFVKST